MTSPFDDSFHKITRLDDLTADMPSIFRAAGATIVLRRDGERVEAIDGSCVSDEPGSAADAKLRRILDCVAAGTGAAAGDWQDIHARGGLAVRVDAGDVWVCLEGCRPARA